MSKTLYLVRHAESAWNTGETDFERTLNSQGERDAPEMGRWLKDRGALPELIVCSPATRARQTLDALDLGIDTVVFDTAIYEASAGDLLNLVQSLDDSHDSVMLVGHNPAVTLLANVLSGVHNSGMPPCSVIAFALEADRWKSAGASAAEQLFFEYP